MKGKLKKIAASIALGCMMIMQVMPVYASETFATGDNFTQIFHTRGFMGNAEVLTKLNFVSGIVSAVISICGFIGVSLTVIRMMASLLYKSNPVIFDEIDEIKKSNSWSGGEGIKGNIGGAAKFLLGGSINGIKEKSGGGIFDTIIWFFLGAMPNVKNYSDFSDGGDESLKDLSTTQYILKISPKVIMQIFFFSIAWNGVLFQAYGSVVDAMGVAAQRVVSDDLAVAVENALETGKKYTFTFKNNGTAFGNFQQKVANDMYSKACKKMSKSTRSQQQYHEVGAAINEMVAKLDKNDVIQIGSARSQLVNMNSSSENDLLNLAKWNGASTEKIDGELGSVVGEFEEETNGGVKIKYTVTSIVKDNQVVGYTLGGNNMSPRYMSIGTTDLVESSSVYEHAAINSYVTDQQPANSTLNDWEMNEGILQYVTIISNCGANSQVAWSMTSETTENLYLVCNIYYIDNASAGTNYFEKVSKNGSSSGKEVTKTATQENSNKPKDGINDQS